MACKQLTTRNVVRFLRFVEEAFRVAALLWMWACTTRPFAGSCGVTVAVGDICTIKRSG